MTIVVNNNNMWSKEKNFKLLCWNISRRCSTISKKMGRI
ncbi:hypothetical protein Gotur_032383 [Gossypium turneri]